MNNKIIDFTKIVSEEDIQHSINDNLKGMIVLLDGMIYADEYGTHKNQKESYNALITLLSSVINKVNNAAKSGVLEIPCQSDKIQILRVDNGTRDKL